MDARFPIEEEDLCMPDKCAKEVRVCHFYPNFKSLSRELYNVGKLIDCDKT